jgi:hypothetical protein|tara:strand:+ start:1254 stop:1601 length:348 start_codon:yes stop_codon:yes gene_type:complete
MIVLQETNNAQNINFIPREYTAGASYTFNIVDETQNKSVYSQATTGVTQNLYYNRYSASFTTLKQGIYYMLTVLSGTNVIFKDKIYCTNQTDLPQYTINSGEYTSNDTTNEFITI